MSDPSAPIHVSAGFSPTFWATSATGLMAFFGLIGVWIKQRNPLRKINIGAEERMREELHESLRISEKKREKEKVALESEIRILRHRLNNVQHAMDLLIALLEANPEKVHETLIKVKEIRAEQARSEAMEKGAVMAAKIEGAGE